MNLDHLHPAEQLVEMMTRIYNLRLTTPSGGNLSIKDDEGNVWVTPSQIDKGTLTKEDIIKITPDGQFVGKHKPTMEYPFHVGIYNVRPDVKAIVHNHSTGMVAFCAVHKTPEFNMIPMLSKNCPDFGYSGYGIPGSIELKNEVVNAFNDGHNVVLLENHGIATAGSNIVEAYHRMIASETLANTFIEGAKLGTVKGESRADIDKARDVKTPVNSIATPEAKDHEILEELVHYAKRCHERGLLGDHAGFISVRLDESRFAITPEGKIPEELEVKDIWVIEDFAAAIAESPASYVATHAAIYKQNAEVKSVGTVAPLSLMAFAISGTVFDSRTIPESYIFLSEVQTIDFNLRLTDPMRVGGMISKRTPNIMCQNDCFIATGKGIFDLFDRMEVAEFTARSIIDSRMIGKIEPISDEAIQEIIETYMK